MKTLAITLIASFLFCLNILGQNYDLNKEMANKSKLHASIQAKKVDAVMMQKMTTKDRTENWNKLFKSLPESGFVVFDTDVNDYFFFNGKNWEQVIFIERDLNGNIINDKRIAVKD
jgi:hypothetical protein